jgi:hypothetical protein
MAGKLASNMYVFILLNICCLCIVLPHWSVRAFQQFEHCIFCSTSTVISMFNPLNAELNPIYHLLALLGAHHIFHVSRIRVKYGFRHHRYRRSGISYCWHVGRLSPVIIKLFILCVLVQFFLYYTSKCTAGTFGLRTALDA